MFWANAEERDQAMKFPSASLATSSLSLSLSLSLSSRRQRRRPRPRLSAFLLLTITAVLLSSSVSLVKSDQSFHKHDIDPTTDTSNLDYNSDGDNTPARSERDEARSELGTELSIEEDASTSVRIVDPTPNIVELLSSDRNRNRIWIVLAYRESCDQSMELLRKLRDDAIPKIRYDSYHDENGRGDRPEIGFAPMPIDGDGNEMNAHVVGRIGVVRLPSLFFLWDEEEAAETEPLVHASNVLTFMEVYRGLANSTPELVNGLNHYLTRLLLRPSSQLPGTPQLNNNNYGSMPPLTSIRVRSLEHLQNIVRNERDGPILQRSPLPLDPNLSEEDDRWIRYLMDDDSGLSMGAAENEPDPRDSKEDKEETRMQPLGGEPFRVVVQCRRRGTATPSSNAMLPTNREVYQEFDKAAKLIGARRDVLFSILEPGTAESGNFEGFASFCRSGGDPEDRQNDDDDDDDDGRIRIWDVRSGDDPLLHNGRDIDRSLDVMDELSFLLRPDLLWFDRRMTAPIAFHRRYLRHAVLFVDLHDSTSAPMTRDVVRIFREECQKLRREQLEYEDRRDLAIVCLVVPSTEVRVLNTFGIDIYSQLDQKATEKIRATVCNHRMQEQYDSGAHANDHFCDDLASDLQRTPVEMDDSNFSSVLPTLLVTHRRNDGTGIERHYFDPPITRNAIGRFLDDFVHGRTKPERKSGPYSEKYDDQTVPTNKHFVSLLTANSLPGFLDANRNKHVLVQLYAPTCGHCKRFNTIWNSLGQLIEYLGWSDKLVLARIDVTANELFVPGMVATWLPDLFYFGMGVVENPIHYEKTQFADEVELGGISDPLDVLEWWMDEAGDSIDESELLRGLETVARTPA